MGTMLDLDRVIADLDAKATAGHSKAMVIREGRLAFRAGKPYSACPDFKQNDMRIDWQNGWRWEREDSRRRRAQ